MLACFVQLKAQRKSACETLGVAGSGQILSRATPKAAESTGS